jgi:excisionase family DNA binding protein
MQRLYRRIVESGTLAAEDRIGHMRDRHRPRRGSALTVTGAALLERAAATDALMRSGAQSNTTELPEVTDGIERFYTLEAVAEVTGYSIRRLRDFVKSGELETERWGREYRVSTPALRAFIEARRGAAIPERQRPGSRPGAVDDDQS